MLLSFLIGILIVILIIVIVSWVVSSSNGKKILPTIGNSQITKRQNLVDFLPYAKYEEVLHSYFVHNRFEPFVFEKILRAFINANNLNWESWTYILIAMYPKKHEYLDIISKSTSLTNAFIANMLRLQAIPTPYLPEKYFRACSVILLSVYKTHTPQIFPQTFPLLDELETGTKLFTEEPILKSYNPAFEDGYYNDYSIIENGTRRNAAACGILMCFATLNEVNILLPGGKLRVNQRKFHFLKNLFQVYNRGTYTDPLWLVEENNALIGDTKKINVLRMIDKRFSNAFDQSWQTNRSHNPQVSLDVRLGFGYMDLDFLSTTSNCFVSFNERNSFILGGINARIQQSSQPTPTSCYYQLGNEDSYFNFRENVEQDEYLLPGNFLAEFVEGEETYRSLAKTKTLISTLPETFKYLHRSRFKITLEVIEIEGIPLSLNRYVFLDNETFNCSIVIVNPNADGKIYSVLNTTTRKGIGFLETEHDVEKQSFVTTSIQQGRNIVIHSVNEVLFENTKNQIAAIMPINYGINIYNITRGSNFQAPNIKLENPTKVTYSFGNIQASVESRSDADLDGNFQSREPHFVTINDKTCFVLIQLIEENSPKKLGNSILKKTFNDSMLYLENPPL